MQIQNENGPLATLEDDYHFDPNSFTYYFGQMRKLKTVTVVLASLFLILFAGYGLLWLLYSWFSNIEDDLAKTIVTLVIAAISSLITNTMNKFSERRAETDRKIREKKVEVYESLLELIFRAFKSSKKGQPATSEEFIEAGIDNIKGIITWGSNDVISSYREFLKASRSVEVDENTSGSIQLLSKLEDVLLAIRKDLGHETSASKRFDLLGIMITDIDRHKSEAPSDRRYQQND